MTGRVAGRVVELATRFGETVPGEDGIVVRIPISQEELASWTGSSRKAVVAALRTMRAREWIVTGRHQLVVRDLAALQARAT